MACWVNWADTGHHQHRSSWFKKKTAPGFLLCSQVRFCEQRWRWLEFSLAQPVIQSRSLPLEGLPMVDQVTQVALFVAQIAQIWCEFQTVLSSLERSPVCTMWRVRFELYRVIGVLIPLWNCGSQWNGGKCCAKIGKAEVDVKKRKAEVGVK